MIRPDGTAVLTDFGIATVDGSHTLTAPGAAGIIVCAALAVSTAIVLADQNHDADGDEAASLPPGQWVMRAPANFADGYAALAFCATSGAEQCSVRYPSNNGANRGCLCDADPSPDPATCRPTADGSPKP